MKGFEKLRSTPDVNKPGDGNYRNPNRNKSKSSGSTIPEKLPNYLQEPILKHVKEMYRPYSQPGQLEGLTVVKDKDIEGSLRVNDKDGVYFSSLGRVKENDPQRWQDLGRDIRKQAVMENFNSRETWAKGIKEKDLNNLRKIDEGVYSYTDRNEQERRLPPEHWTELQKAEFKTQMEKVEGQLSSLGFDLKDPERTWGQYFFGVGANKTELPKYAEKSVRQFAIEQLGKERGKGIKIERGDDGKIWLKGNKTGLSDMSIDELRKTDEEGGKQIDRENYQQIGYDMRRQAFADNLNRLQATRFAEEPPIIKAEDIKNLKKLDDGTYSYEHKGAKYELRQQDIIGYGRKEGEEFKDQMDKADNAISSLGFGVKNKIPEATEKAVLESATAALIKPGMDANAIAEIKEDMEGATVLDYNRNTGEWYLQKDGQVRAYKPDSEAAEQIKDDAEKHAFMKHAGDKLTMTRADGTTRNVDDVLNVMREKDGTYTVHYRDMQEENIQIDKATQNKIDADRGILDIDKSSGNKKSIFDMRYRSDLIGEKEEALTRLKRKVKWIKWGLNSLEYANSALAMAGQNFDAAVMEMLKMGGGQQQQEPATIKLTHAIAKGINKHYKRNVEFAKKELAILKEHPEHANMMRQLKDMDAKMRHQYKDYVKGYNFNNKSNHLPANLSDLSFDEI